MTRIGGDAIRNVSSPHVDTDRLKSEVDNIQHAIFHGKPIEVQGDVVVKINDYMCFHFPTIIRHPWQGKSPFWRFAVKLGRQPSRQPIFRCLLCQKVDNGSLQAKLRKHLNGECRGMTFHAQELLRGIENSLISKGKKEDPAQKNKMSAHKRPAITVVISKDHSRPTKFTRTQPAGPSASKGPADPETVVADGSCTETSVGDLGYALLKSLSSLLPQAFAEKLETSLDIINGAATSELRWHEAMKAKSVMLDVILSTDVPKEKFKELSNYFDYIISQSVYQPLPSSQLHAPPTHLELPPISNPRVLFNIDRSHLQISVQSNGMQPVMSEQLAASTATQLMEKVVMEAPPSPYGDVWDYLEEGLDGGPEEQAQQSPRSEQSVEP